MNILTMQLKRAGLSPPFLLFPFYFSLVPFYENIFQEFKILISSAWTFLFEAMMGSFSALQLCKSRGNIFLPCQFVTTAPADSAIRAPAAISQILGDVNMVAVRPPFAT
jgi:hypothetical protein